MNNSLSMTGPVGDAKHSIVCRGLTKSFGEGPARVMALRSVDLNVVDGELVMLVGPSGCGKTTLISIVAGILDQDAGRCQVLGQELSALNDAAKARFRRHMVGFVFQAYHLIPQLDLANNVMIPLLLGGLPYATALTRARDALAQVGLADRWASLPRQLSGGQQQRVAIARALVHDPKLIVCDEPTSALDHATGQRVMEILRDVVESDKRTLVVVTHDARILHYADRTAHMDDGRITAIDRASRKESTLGNA